MSKLYKLLILSGDGIGPEVMDEVIKVAKCVEEKSDVVFEIQKDDIGEQLMIDMVFPYQMKH